MNNFNELLTRWGDRVRTTDDLKNNGELLTELATAVGASVLKKLDEKSSNPTIKKLRSSFQRDIRLTANTQRAIENGTTERVKTNGDVEIVTTDKAYRDAEKKLVSATFSDAFDLFQTASLAIVSLTEQYLRAVEKGSVSCHNSSWLTSTVSYRKPKRTIYHDLNGIEWETAEDIAIRVIFKQVRASIEHSGAVESANGKYTYISYLVKDDESGAIAGVYVREPKYFAMESDTFEAVTALVEKMQLTDLQRRILNYRLSGYGNKQTAKLCGVTENSVKGGLREIRRKAVLVGITIE